MTKGQSCSGSAVRSRAWRVACLVPGLTLEAGRLGEELRLHHLHAPVPVRQVRADNLLQGPGQQRMLRVLDDDRADEVGVYDGVDPAWASASVVSAGIGGRLELG